MFGHVCSDSAQLICNIIFKAPSESPRGDDECDDPDLVRRIRAYSKRDFNGFVRRLPVERTVRSTEVVEALPLLELLVEIDVVSVREKLVELLFVRPMRTLDFPVQLR